MKNSNKLLLAALLLLLAFLATYNIGLRAEYQKGTYKDKESYRNFNSLAFKDFNVIAVNSANKISVRIMQGPYKVSVFKDAAQFIKITQQGNQLKVDVTLPEEQKIFGPAQQLVISLPELHTLQTNAIYTVNGKQIISKEKKDWYNVALQGFCQPSLALQQDNGSVVNLIDNKIGKLQVITGLSSGSGSELNIAKGNTFQEADLDIRNKSQISMNDVLIPQLNYQFADSARVTLVGASLNILKQDKN